MCTELWNFTDSQANAELINSFVVTHLFASYRLSSELLNFAATFPLGHIKVTGRLQLAACNDPFGHHRSAYFHIYLVSLLSPLVTFGEWSLKLSTAIKRELIFFFCSLLVLPATQLAVEISMLFIYLCLQA